MNTSKSKAVVALVSNFFIQTLQFYWVSAKGGSNYLLGIINAKN